MTRWALVLQRPSRNESVEGRLSLAFQTSRSNAWYSRRSVLDVKSRSFAKAPAAPFAGNQARNRHCIGWAPATWRRCSVAADSLSWCQLPWSVTGADALDRPRVAAFSGRIGPRGSSAGRELMSARFQDLERWQASFFPGRTGRHTRLKQSSSCRNAGTLRRSARPDMVVSLDR